MRETFTRVNFQIVDGESLLLSSYLFFIGRGRGEVGLEDSLASGNQRKGVAEMLI